MVRFQERFIPREIFEGKDGWKMQGEERLVGQVRVANGIKIVVEILKYFLTWKFQIREIIDQVEQLEAHFR